MNRKKPSIKKKIRAALIGNPNTGKTSLFNLLTKSTKPTGNWIGVTVLKESNTLRYGDCEIELIDLPGIYNLSIAREISKEQKEIYNTIIEEDIDLIINVIDYVNLERNLYLTTQLLDVGKPMVIALNFTEQLDETHVEVSRKTISNKLRLPVVTVSSKKSNRIEDLKKAIAICNFSYKSINTVPYPRIIEDAIDDITKLIATPKLNRFLAVKIIEENECGDAFIEHSVFHASDELKKQIEEAYAESAEVVMISSRLEFIKTLIPDGRIVSPINKLDTAIDKIVLGKISGTIIFLIMMLLMFTFSINIGGIFQDPIELVARAIFIDFSSYLLGIIHTPEFLKLVISGGIGGGMTTVAAFIPVIAGLFLFLSFMEESGYLARAAILVDSLLKKIGLPGSAFVPLIVSFGCNVPAIYATRILHKKEDQIKTAIMAPFMSCSARLAVYSLFCAAFFRENAAFLVFSLYILGIILALFTGFILNKLFGKDESPKLVLELPRYHFPSLYHLLKKTIIRLNSFIFGAGKTIVIIFIIVQTLSGLTHDWEVYNKSQNDSVLTEIGKASTSIFKPMGLNEEHWPLSVSILTGVLAKEVVIGTLSAIYNKESVFEYPHETNIAKTKESFIEAWYIFKENLSKFTMVKNFFDLSEYEFQNTHADSNASAKSLVRKLHANIQDKVAVVAYLIFILLYFPCISVFAAIKQEIGIKWAIFSAVWSTSLAYIVAAIFYQVASLFL
jgi:ferrous iron transport protein B